MQFHVHLVAFIALLLFPEAPIGPAAVAAFECAHPRPVYAANSPGISAGFAVLSHRALQPPEQTTLGVAAALPARPALPPAARRAAGPGDQAAAPRLP